MSNASLSRRGFLQAGTIAGALTAGGAAPVHAQPRKVLRYAFRVAETGFDPAQVNDLYSSTINANLFEAPLTYDYLARPAKIVLNTAESMPEISSDYRTFTFRIRPGIRFLDHPAFNGKPRELVAADYVYSLKRFYDPRLKSPRLYLFETAGVLGMGEIRAAALKGCAPRLRPRGRGPARARPVHLPRGAGRTEPALLPVLRRQLLHRSAGARGLREP